jgi:arginyl-tRNA--protein-N-Asp/Glu arginylyltransferase
MSAPVRFPRFFVTNPAPCPYLPGQDRTQGFHRTQRRSCKRTERGAWPHRFSPQPECRLSAQLHRLQGLRRRSHPDRRFSTQCHPAQDPARNSDLRVSACRPWSTSEQYELLRRYLKQRHPEGGMADMDDMDYADMVEQTPVHSHVVEYRLPARYGAQGELVGACITDQQSDGLSMVYSFYDAEAEGRPGWAISSSWIISMRARAAGCPLSIWAIGSKVRRACNTRPAIGRSKN